MLDALVQHCAEKNVIAIEDVTLPLLENWRNGWEFSRETARKKQHILKGFFEYALQRDHITKNPAKGLGKIKGSDRKPTLPLDDAQFAQLLAAIPKLNGQTTDDTRTKLRGICLLQRWTGLAIKDAVLFERKRLQKDSHGYFQVFLYRAKTGNPVYCMLRADVAEELLAIPNTSERYMFITHRPTGERELETLIAWWASRARRVGELAELKNDHGEPMVFGTHMLRDSFAIWALNQGFALEEVAALLGDSPKVVADHYAPWVKTRQDVLTKKMRAALSGPSIAKRA
ncbi:MAG: tyrosine-type recombinase/integrase [Terriglobales bacterium]